MNVYEKTPYYRPLAALEFILEHRGYAISSNAGIYLTK